MATSTTQSAFSAMRGHVAPDVRVALADGRTVRLVSELDGWRIVDDETDAVLAYCGLSAAAVEYAIVRL